MSEPDAAVPGRRRWPIVVALVVVAMLIGAGTLVWGRGRAPVGPDSTAGSGPLAVRLAESTLEGTAGQQFLANMSITGGPAFRLSMTVRTPDGFATSSRLADTSARGAEVGALVTVSTPLAAPGGSHDITVTTTGCAEDADPCPSGQQQSATTSFALRLLAPTATSVPPGLSSPAPDRLVARDRSVIVKDEYQVFMREDLSEPDSAQQAIDAARATGGVFTGGLPKIGDFDVAYPGTSEADAERITSALRGQPGVVDAISRNVTPGDPQSAQLPWSPLESPDEMAAAPPRATEPWHLNLINAKGAWALTNGAPKVRIGVIDTGIHSGHQFLKGNMKSVLRYSSLPPNTFDEYGKLATHGTHTSGTMCSIENPAPKTWNNKSIPTVSGMAGVAYRNCELRGYDLGSEGNVPEYAARAMLDATDDGNRVVNLSMGWGSNRCKQEGRLSAKDKADHETLFSRAFGYARKGNRGAGTLFVISAGNGCVDFSEHVPASMVNRFPDVALAVGSVDEDHKLSDFSNTGTGVLLAAGGGAGSPGDGQLSTVDGVGTTFTDTGYNTAQGTSMSAPQVAAIGGLVFARHQDFNAKQIAGCLLLGGTTPVIANKDNPFKPGDMKIIDAATAVRCGDGTVVAPPGPLGPTAIGNQSAGTAPAPTPTPTYQAPQVVVVLDTSGSMGDKDQSGKVVKMDAAKSALNDFIQGLDASTLVGLWSYPSPAVTPAANGCSTAGGPIIGSTAGGTTPLNQADMSARVRSLTPNGDTPTGPALRAAAGLFRGNGPRTIVLVSDGEPTCGEGTPDGACAVAKDLQHQGITSIYTVGFQLSATGKSLMQCVANEGHGVYTDATNGEQLKDKIPELARAKLTLEMNLPPRTPLGVGSGETPSAPITVKVTNAGNADAFNVTANLAFDNSAGSIGSSNKRLGNLLKGESRQVQWDFRPKASFADVDVEFRAGAEALNADQAAPISKRTVVSGRVTLDQAGPLLKGKSNPVIFGDSYSAGEGAFEYDRETDTYDNSCHRSRYTYATGLFPQALTQAGHTRHVFACSGAISNDVYSNSDRNRDPHDASRPMPSQLVEYRNDPDFQAKPADVALMTIGGNDLDLEGVVESCLVFPCDVAKLQKTRDELLAALPAKLRLTYQAVDGQLNDADSLRRRKGQVAPIIVLGYPNIFPDLHVPTGCARDFEGREQALITSLGDRLNSVVQSTVQTMRDHGYPIYFAGETAKAMRPDHTICAKERWANEIDLSDVVIKELVATQKEVESWYISSVFTEWAHRRLDLQSFRNFTGAYHPNRDGYQAMTSALVRFTNTPEGKVPVTRGNVAAVPRSIAEPARPAFNVSIEAGIPLPRLVPGVTVKVSIPGLTPGNPFEIRLLSSPRIIGRGYVGADGTGTTDVVIPPDLEEGDHHLEVLSTDAEGRPIERSEPLSIARVAPWWWHATGAAALLLLAASGVVAAFARRVRRRTAEPS